ncbi:MAG: sugar phosphate isomerase/epimerase family protein [Fusobacteriaceae bacterium]
MKIGIESESYHLLFQNKRMDVFGFIEKASELGLDGVQINVVPDFNLHEVWGTLGGNSPEHLQKIKKHLEKYNLYVELDSRNLDVNHLKELVLIASFLGAEVIRSYIPVKQKKIPQGQSGAEGIYDFAKVRQVFDVSVYEDSLKNLLDILPFLKKYRIKLALENHEYETSEELIKVIKKINSPWIGLNFDFGNSMMAWEEPLNAAKNMLPYSFTTHFKDHIIIEDKNDKYNFVVCGVPLGEGNIDLDSLYKLMLETSSLTKVNIEICYPYCAQFKREPGTGGVFKVGKGAFKVEPAPFEHLQINPLQYYYPHEISESVLEELIQKQIDGVEKSVDFIKKLRNKYLK